MRSSCASSLFAGGSRHGLFDGKDGTMRPTSTGCADGCSRVHHAGLLLGGTRSCTAPDSVTRCINRTGFFHTCSCFSLLRLCNGTVLIGRPVRMASTQVCIGRGSHDRITSFVVGSLGRTIPLLPGFSRVRRCKHVDQRKYRTFLSQITLCRNA